MDTSKVITGKGKKVQRWSPVQLNLPEIDLKGGEAKAEEDV